MADIAIDGVYAVHLTLHEIAALNTLCELELGSREADRIEAWRQADTAQDKLLELLSQPALRATRNVR